MRKMPVCIALLALACVLLPDIAGAQHCPHTPAPGSAERKAVVEALRAPVEQELHQPVIFVIKALNVCDGWAFLDGTPRRPSGTPIDYKITRYRQAVAAGAFDDGIVALLRNAGGNWSVVTY